MNDQDVTAVLERVIGPLEDEMGSWDDVLRRAAAASPEGWDDVLHPSGAEHPPRRWTFRRWWIVAVAVVLLVGGLLVTPAFGIGRSLLDLLKGGPQPPLRLTAVGGPPFWSPDGKIVFLSRVGTPKKGHYQGIVFSRRHDGQVYVMNADGSGERRLTSRPGAAFADAWSPDGRKIAFTVRSSGYIGIYVMNADGSGQRKLTRASTFGPSWSPDGRKFAFSRVRAGNSEVFVMNADGSAKRRLTRQPAGG